jgi:hypothetical protein
MTVFEEPSMAILSKYHCSQAAWFTADNLGFSKGVRGEVSIEIEPLTKSCPWKVLVIQCSGAVFSGIRLWTNVKSSRHIERIMFHILMKILSCLKRKGYERPEKSGICREV